MSVLSVLCCQVKSFGMGRFLVYRSPTVCVCVCVSECDEVPRHVPRVGRKRSRLRKKERKERNLCEGYSKTCQKVFPQPKCRQVHHFPERLVSPVCRTNTRAKQSRREEKHGCLIIRMMLTVPLRQKRGLHCRMNPCGLYVARPAALAYSCDPLLWFKEHAEGIRSWPANDHMKNIPPGNTDITSCCRLIIQEALSFTNVNTSILTLSWINKRCRNKHKLHSLEGILSYLLSNRVARTVLYFKK